MFRVGTLAGVCRCGDNCGDGCGCSCRGGGCGSGCRPRCKAAPPRMPLPPVSASDSEALSTPSAAARFGGLVVPGAAALPSPRSDSSSSSCGSAGPTNSPKPPDGVACSAGFSSMRLSITATFASGGCEPTERMAAVGGGGANRKALDRPSPLACGAAADPAAALAGCAAASGCVLGRPALCPAAAGLPGLGSSLAEAPLAAAASDLAHGWSW
mmetsp:Transcript_98698/g.313152  ORF Transcript_98698/g.313152 Transcript_98698/m.313152 type:complete len:213 (+) Transcript_98698:1113-1751(+)